jgi:transcriptional regulator with XRE-family HTH domain
MTPQEFKEARQTLGLSANQLARVLGMGEDGGRTIRKWEADASLPTARPPNPVAAQAMRWFLAGFRPPEWPKG